MAGGDRDRGFDESDDCSLAPWPCPEPPSGAFIIITRQTQHFRHLLARHVSRSR